MIFLIANRSMRFILLVCMLFIAMTSFIGCRMTVLPPSSDDSARDRNAVLREENEALKRENDGLKIRLSEAQAGLDPRAVMVSEVTPRLVSMVVQDSSLVEISSDETEPPTLVLRMAPSDDRGRFLQVVGDLSITVVGVPESGEPILLARREFSPPEVRDGWRGGMLGSGYVFEIPLSKELQQDLPESVDVVTLFQVAGIASSPLRDERPVRVERAGD
jgi:hypothetical protein